MKPQNRYLFCQYFDELRQETDGKATLLGLYSGDLYLHVPLPTTIEKLWVQANIWTPPGQPFERLTLRILFNGEEWEQLSLPEEHIRTMAENNARIGTRVEIAAELRQLPITAPGQITVQLETESETLWANGLNIKQKAPAGSSPAS